MDDEADQTESDGSDISSIVELLVPDNRVLLNVLAVFASHPRAQRKVFIICFQNYESVILEIQYF